MTVGEKIQYYRKKNGLSQDDLGQKLLVSRQTISLWEMNKTLPSIDNLLRLKEIFSVSVDDILSEEEPVEARGDAPKESYLFNYNEGDVNEIFRKSKRQIPISIAVFSICFFIFLFYIIGGGADGFTVTVSLFIYGIVVGANIKNYIIYRKNNKASKLRLLSSTYIYEVYDIFFAIKVAVNNEIIKYQKIEFTDIEKHYIIGKYLILVVAGQSYIINKEHLSVDSAFNFYLNKKTDDIEKINNPKGKEKTFSKLLFIGSLMSIFGALIWVAVLSGINKAFVENMWAFYLFVPITLGSFVFGLYLKKRGLKYKKNLITGIIMTVLLCIYGSFSFIFSDIYTHDEKTVLRVEEILEIDIPDAENINTQDWTKGTQSTVRGKFISTSDLYFDKNTVKDFENNLPYDNKWQSSITNDMVGITSYYFDLYAHDYFIIYNLQTKEFNKLPAESGTYTFFNILYNSETNVMNIIEYEIEYIK